MEKPTDCIPHGMYCYKLLTIDFNTGRSKVEWCPYFSQYFDPGVNQNIPAEKDCEDAHFVPFCAYLETDGKDSLLLYDHCKECGENDDEFEDYDEVE